MKEERLFVTLILKTEKSGMKQTVLVPCVYTCQKETDPSSSECGTLSSTDPEASVLLF